jgi:hypothetical protein
MGCGASTSVLGKFVDPHINVKTSNTCLQIRLCMKREECISVGRVHGTYNEELEQMQSSKILYEFKKHTTKEDIWKYIQYDIESYLKEETIEIQSNFHPHIEFCENKDEAMNYLLEMIDLLMKTKSVWIKTPEYKDTWIKIPEDFKSI